MNRYTRKQIGNSISYYRQQANLNPEQLANIIELDLTEQDVIECERGNLDISYPEMACFAKALNISAKTLHPQDTDLIMIDVKYLPKLKNNKR